MFWNRTRIVPFWMQKKNFHSNVAILISFRTADRRRKFWITKYDSIIFYDFLQPPHAAFYCHNLRPDTHNRHRTDRDGARTRFHTSCSPMSLRIIMLIIIISNNHKNTFTHTHSHTPVDIVVVQPVRDALDSMSCRPYHLLCLTTT